MLQLRFGMQGLGTSPAKREGETDVRAVQKLFVASGVCHSWKVALEALCQPRLPVKGRQRGVKCGLCERQAEGGLCQYHLEARTEVEAAYRRWAEAYGSMSSTEFLKRVIGNPETGEWAADVARMLLRSEREGQTSAARSFKS